MKSRVALAVAFSALTAYMPSVYAEDDKGRLPDGRAFRTDSQGNQLVDYIAELELSVDALRRQVSGLEGEVEQKQALIDKIGNRGYDAPIVERNLVGAPKPAACKEMPCDCTAKIQDKVRELQSLSEENEKEFLQRINSLQGERTQELAQAQRTIDRMRNEAAQKDVLLKSYETGVQNVSNEKDRVQAVLHSKTKEVAELRTQESELQETVDTLEARVASLQSHRESLSSQEAALLKVIDEKKRKAAESKAEADAIIVEQPRPAQVQEVRMQPLQEEAAPSVASNSVGRQADTRASFSIARESAFDSLRGRLTTTMNQIQGLITSRDRMYNEYIRGPQVVAFKPAEARSTRGQGLPELRVSVQEAQSARELSLLTRDINEIRSKIEFDIGMMERVKRLR